MSGTSQRLDELSPQEKRALLAQLLRQKEGAVSTIPRLPRQGATTRFPLSFAQQRLWILDQLAPGNPVYNESGAFRLTGPLNIAALEQTLNEIVRRHEALRTTFVAIEGSPVQVIAPVLTLPLPRVDLSELPETEREAQLRRLTTEHRRRTFDLARGPLVRSALLRLGEKEHVLCITVHHIVGDGWSFGVLMREFAVLYDALSAGRPSPLAALPIQYADFAVWQRQWLQGEVLETQLSYWKQQLGGSLPVLELPTDRPRPAVQTFRGATQAFVLSKPMTESLKELSRREGVTLFMTLLAAFKALLSRYTGQGDILVGSPIAGRTRIETEGLIGFFVNLLALRTDLAGNPSFRELLHRVREVCLGAYAHQDLPFEKLVEELRPERDLSHLPLVQVGFVLHLAVVEPLELAGSLTLSPLEVDAGTAKFDAALFMWEGAEGLKGALEYNTDLFNDDTIARMLRHFKSLLEGVVANPEQRLSDLPLLTEAEHQQLLVAWNATERAYPQDQCIHQLFEAQVERTPDAVALVFEDAHVTYRALNRRANQLAHHLRPRGVGPDVLVGLCVERSLEMVVGLLGVLKAGGAYVPLDPTYPPDRLAFMVADTQMPVLLSQQGLLQRLPTPQAQALCLDTAWEAISMEPEDNPCSPVTPAHLAYVIYTSGSTGRPKGVLLHHRGLCNFATACVQEMGIRDDSCLLQFASISFDASVAEIFDAFVAGAKQCLMTRDTVLSVPDFVRRLQEQAVTTAILPPSLLATLPAEELPALQMVISAGESCAVDIVARWASGRRFFNAYGPTEATVGPTWYLVKDMAKLGTSIPIGRPIANTQLYLLDRYLKPVPVGVPGELYIGGVGLARGYGSRPELTAERFIPHPFSAQPGARLYKTGDLARYLPDGNVEFLGRLDQQVKIRGFRIELGEIEAVLGLHTAVREAVVLAREEGAAGKRLVAYLVAKREFAPSSAELRSFLRDKLPEYMMPSAFVLLEALPLTPNGKVDRKALPNPEGRRLDSKEPYVMPRNEMERAIVAMWQGLLHVEKVGIHDNFFDLGGHSLLGTQLVSQLQKTFQVEFLLRSLFKEPTVAGIAKIIVTAKKDKQSAVDKIAEVLRKIEHLSEDEAKTLLAEKIVGN